MAEESGRRGGVLRSAGRTALAVLRQSRRRAKLGTLHLPVDLHPSRQQTILLPPSSHDPAQETTTAHLGTMDDSPHAPYGSTVRVPRPVDEMRALRSRLASSERRVLRLRRALERERQGRAQANAALAQPGILIDHLVADLGQVDHTDADTLRQTVAQVLGAYGFAVPGADQVPLSQTKGRATGEAPTPPSVPGWDRGRLEAMARRLQERRPEIGDQRYIYQALQALAQHGAVTPATAASEAGLTSGLARHRLRMALEGLCAEGVARRDGQRFSLVTQHTPAH